jgi:5-methyltetrahydropteroyltriglutamate--homocysteine methyltransferase
MAKGSYGAIAEEVLRRTHARVILLEYDDERSGDFSPLALAGEDKIIALGLVTTKRPREETSDELIGRIREAARHVPLERLALSTQCGFASVAKGNNIPFEVQERKLALVAQVARDIWG